MNDFEDFVKRGMAAQDAVDRLVGFRLITGDLTGKVAAIECMKCGSISYNPMDILHRYCGQCKAFHEPTKV